MKKTIVLIIFLAVALFGCSQSTSLQATASDTAEPVETEQAAVSAESTVNDVFVNPPDTAARDEQRAFDPTDIVQFSGLYGDPLSVYEETIRSHVTIFCPDFTSENEDPSDDIYMSRLSAENGIASINWDAIYSTDSEDYSDCYAIDIDGNVVYADPELIGTTGPRECVSSLKWQDYVISLHILPLLRGKIASVTDEWTASPVCFCDDCMEGFRNYLKQHYTDGELLVLGIDNIDEFDYGDYIRENYYDEFKERYSSVSIDPNIPLGTLYNRFKYEEITAFEKRISDEIAKANEIYGTDMMLSANMDDLKYRELSCADSVDFFAPEVYLTHDPSPRSALRYELANAFGTVMLGMPNCGQAARLMLSEDVTDITKIYTAEAYAHGGLLQSPFQAPYKSEVGKSVAETHTITQPDMEELYPYYDFITNNPVFFNELWPMANVGVLYSYASAVSDAYISDFCFWRSSRTLIENGIQLRIVATGDGNLVSKELTASDLDGLSVLILPQVDYISQNDREVLRAFIRSGGTVLAWNTTAHYDETGNEVNDEFSAYPLDTVESEGYYHIPGYFVWSEDSEINNIEPENVNEILEKLSEFAVPGCTVDDSDITITQYFSGSFDGYLYHVVNYAYDENMHQVEEKRDVKIKLLNDTPYTGDSLTAYYSIPESGEITQLDIEYTEDGCLEVFIPYMKAWAVIMLGDPNLMDAAIDESDIAAENRKENRIETLSEYVEEVVSNVETIGDDVWTLTPAVINETEIPAQSEATIAEQFIYNAWKDAAGTIIQTMPDAIQNIFRSYPPAYIAVYTEEPGQVRYYFSYDDANMLQTMKDAFEDVLEGSWKEDGDSQLLRAGDMEARVQIENNNLQMNLNMANEPLAEMIAGLYETADDAWDILDLYEGLNNAAYSMHYNTKEEKLSLYVEWRADDEAGFQAAEAYYRQRLTGLYYTDFAGDSSEYFYNTHVDGGVAMCFRFSAEDETLNISLLIP